MRKLAFLGGVVLVLGLAYVLVDLVTKSYVEGRVADEFRDSDRLQVEEASFEIDSFPFLFRLAAFAEVSAMLHLGGIEEQGVTIDAFDLEVDGLVFDRSSAFNGDVRVNGLDRATASVALSEETITDLVGVPVSITDGAVTADGVQIQASLEGGELAIAGEGVGRVTVPVSLDRYLPCEPDLVLGDRRVTLTCVTERLPAIVNLVLGQAGAGLGPG